MGEGRYDGEVRRVHAGVCAALGGDLTGWLRLNPYTPEPPQSAAAAEAEAKEARSDIAAVLGHLNAAAGVTSA